MRRRRDDVGSKDLLFWVKDAVFRRVGAFDVLRSPAVWRGGASGIGGVSSGRAVGGCTMLCTSGRLTYESALSKKQKEMACATRWLHPDCC